MEDEEESETCGIQAAWHPSLILLCKEFINNPTLEKAAALLGTLFSLPPNKHPDLPSEVMDALLSLHAHLFIDEGTVRNTAYMPGINVFPANPTLKQQLTDLISQFFPAHNALAQTHQQVQETLAK